MNKIKLANFDTEVTLSAEKDGVQVIQGIANSLTMTRSGIRVTEDAGKSLVGKVVPLMQSHDWTKPSIGRATMTAVDGQGLHYEATIYDDAPNRNLLLQGIEGGTNYVSIGFGTDNIDKNGNIDTVDLLELSLTSVPADPKATSEIVKQAIEANDDDNTPADDSDDNDQPADNKPKDDAPTIQDVLDALAKLTKEVEAVLPDKKDDDAKDKQPADDSKPSDDATQTESLKRENEELKATLKNVKPLLQAVNTRQLSYSESMTLKRLLK